MTRGKEYKLEKDLNTEYLKKYNLGIFKNPKIPNRLTKYSIARVPKGWLFNRWKRLKINTPELSYLCFHCTFME